MTARRPLPGPPLPPPPIDPSSREFFDAKYATCADPWDFATSPYELQRYRDLLELIGDAPVDRAYEPGCSVGVFTELLAPRCRALVATDLATGAVARARRRCARFDHTVIAVQALPDLPDGRFDLIVFSELGYYLDRAGLVDLVARLAGRLRPDGRLVGTHWTGSSPDHVLSGDAVGAVLDECPRLRPDTHDRRDGYLIGSWSRRTR